VGEAIKGPTAESGQRRRRKCQGEVDAAVGRQFDLALVEPESRVVPLVIVLDFDLRVPGANPEKWNSPSRTGSTV
jgi:hypothetical protein